jgi:hypothetical protein
LRWRISVQTKPLLLGSDCSCEFNERRRNSRRGRGVECEIVVASAEVPLGVKGFAYRRVNVDHPVGLQWQAAAVGLVLLARSVHRLTGGRMLAVVAYVAATLAIVGAVLWALISYIRIIQSPFDVAFVDISPWLFRACGLFTETVFIIFGLVLPRSDYPKWLGWMLIGAGTTMFVGHLALDLLPGVYYLVFMIQGAALLVLRPRWRQSPAPPSQTESFA